MVARLLARLLQRKPDPADPASWLLLACVLYVVAAALLFARLYHFHVVDDAYISFQYARNWVSGHGLVFNRGQYVEGYTNFLWIVLLAPFYAVTSWLDADFTTVAICLSIGLAAVNLGLVYAVARRLWRDDWVATGVALLLCALDNSYVGYAMSALENHLLIFFMLGALLAWLHPSRRAWLGTALCLTGATLTRPDAGLFVVAFATSALLGLALGDTARPWETRRSLAAATGRALGVWLLLFGTYFAWRWAYYAAPLPNTFYLKVGPEIDATNRGLLYSLSFVVDRFYLPIVALAASFWVRHGVIRWMLLWLVAHAAYVTYVGGDFYSGHRFYVVAIPVVALLVGWVVHKARVRLGRLGLHARLERRTGAAALMTGAVCGLLAFGFAQFARRGYERGPYAHEILMWGEYVHNNILFTRWLGTFGKPGESIVVGDIGSTGFLTDLEVRDVYGVIDPTIAKQRVKGFGTGKAGHEKIASRDYLLQRNPTYVKWGFVPGDLRPFGYYLFTDFPGGFRQPALWVREDLGRGHFLQDTMIHFQHAELAAWERTGEAFSTLPTTAPVPGQGPVFGQSGAYLSSFAPGSGDRATGTVTSPAWPLRGDRMMLQVGGGRDPQRLRVSLIVDGQRVHSATGHDHEVLGRRVWDIEAYRGKTGRIEIVDAATGGWGHIMVDEIVQWVVSK